MEQKNTGQTHQTNPTNDNENEQLVITPQQSRSLVASTVIGVGVLTLPRTAAEQAHEAAWIATLLGGLFALFVMWMLTKLALRFPNQTFVEFAPELLGTKRHAKIGRILSIPFVFMLIAYWFFATVSVARTFGEVVVTAVLPKTPLEVIIGTMIVMGAILVFYEIEVLARFNEIVFPIILIPVLITALASFQSFRLDNILPLVSVDWVALLTSAATTMTVYSGFGIILFTIAYTQQKEKIMAANITGMVIPTFLYTLIVVAGVSAFGYEELRLLTWPTLELVKTTEVPGLILERLESAFLGVWVAAVYTTVGNIYYIVCLAISHLLPFSNKKNTRRWSAVILLPAVYWCSLLPQSIHQLFQWMEILSYVDVFLLFLFPLLFYGLAIARKKGRSVSRVDKQNT